MVKCMKILGKKKKGDDNPEENNKPTNQQTLSEWFLESVKTKY